MSFPERLHGESRIIVRSWQLLLCIMDNFNTIEIS